MKIAFIGIRGIPVIYSGFESFAENLGLSLIKKNHSVITYCRRQYFREKLKQYKGITLIFTKSVKNKNLESISHSFLSTLHAIFITRPDTIYYFGVGNAIFTLLPRLFGIRTIINVDGLDWRREKWGKLARLYLLISEYLSTIFPNITITDSEYMKGYYWKKYHKKSIFIPYGVKFDFLINKKILNRYSLKINKYLIWVGRLVPDNHLEELILAYKNVKTKLPLVILGDDFYKGDYYQKISFLISKDKRIIKTGFVDRNSYASLVQNSFAYVETKRSGGTHPSLIEAMKLAPRIISNDNKANKQILNNYGYFYKKESTSDLRIVLERVLRKEKRAIFDKNHRKTTLDKYEWANIFKKYLKLFTQS